ncbi:MAG TPA: tetratricopeptide repeat protein [Syntrophales bacterium]|nr:tetratricopeptide repeat protein [Syntrophales bacterium]
MGRNHIACLAVALIVLLSASATAAGTPSTAYSLHVGSYPSADKAAEQVQVLKEKGYDAFSAKPDGKDGRWRVFVGRYASADEAARQGAVMEKKKAIRFYAVRNIPAAAAPQESAVGKDKATAQKEFPAPESPKAAVPSEMQLHPQVKITPAPEAVPKGKKAALYSFLAKRTEVTADGSVTEGLPLPEPFRFQPFGTGSAGDAQKEAGGTTNAEDELLYAEAVSLYRRGLYAKAVDKFRSYIDQFAGSPRSKASFYWIAECYGQMQDTKKADDAFLQALKRWPDYRDLPREVLVSLGFHFFRQGSYDNVIGVFSYYINIYPEDPFRKEMSYLIARSLTELQQYEPALKVFSTVIERYPESKEATESAIIMANIGVKKPGFKIPAYMAGVQYYKDPVAAYGMVLSKNLPSPELAERILFQQSLAFYQKNRFQEAFVTSITQLKRFPNGSCKDAALVHLKGITERLVDEDYQKADYLRVADTYFMAYESAWVKTVDFGTGYRIADSLRRVGLYRDARRVSDHLLMIEKDSRSRNSLLVLVADVNVRERQYDEAERLVAELAKEAASLGREDRIALRRIQGDLYLRKGLYEKAAASYAEIPSEGAADASILHRNYGVALRFSDACSRALQQFQLAIRQSEKDKAGNSQVLQDSLAGVGDCYLKTHKYPEAVSAYKQAVESAQSGAQNPWTLYNLGKGYVEMKNPAEANRVFSELKVRTGDDFWNKTIDYTLSDSAWTEKYQKYLSTK